MRGRTRRQGTAEKVLALYHSSGFNGLAPVTQSATDGAGGTEPPQPSGRRRSASASLVAFSPMRGARAKPAPTHTWWAGAPGNGHPEVSHVVPFVRPNALPASSGRARARIRCRLSLI